MPEVLNVLFQVSFTFSPGRTTLVDLGLPYEVLRSNLDIPQPVGLHWTSD